MAKAEALEPLPEGSVIPMANLRTFAHSDPLPWALALVSRRAFWKAKSVVMSWALNAPGAYFGPGCHVQGAKYIRFGKHVYATKDLWLEAVSSYDGIRYSPSLILGDRVKFSDSVHISCVERIEIGNDVLMGSCIYISDASHGAYHGAEQSHPSEAPANRRLKVVGHVLIEDNVFIGDQVVILGPARIGRGAIIGAHSLIRGDIAPSTIVGGIPGRPLKQFNDALGVWERL